MAAPLGFKTFNTGDVLSAADTNGYLMQGVLVFADAAARTAAITSPQEGQTSYLKDTDVIQVYSGSAWVTKSGGSSPLTTKGDLYTFGTGDTRLAVGTNGHTLVADSATATGLKWAAPSGGGKVLQVVYATTSTGVNVATTTYTDTGLTATITPTSATSTILVFVNQQGLSAASGQTQLGAGLRLLRAGSAVYTPDNSLHYAQQFATGTGLTNTASMMSFAYQDSPATTSSTIYKVQGATNNTAGGGQTIFQESSSASNIVLMEIGA